MMSRGAEFQRRGIPPLSHRVIGIIIIVDHHQRTTTLYPCRQCGMELRSGWLLSFVGQKKHFVTIQKPGGCCAFDLHRLDRQPALQQRHRQAVE